MITFHSGSYLRSLAGKIIFWPTSPAITWALGEPILRRSGRKALNEKIQLSVLRRVLMIRPDEIGDLVLMSPFLRELRRNLPQAWITLVVKPGVFNLVEICPWVNEVLTFDWSAPKLVAPYLRHWRALKLAQEQLWHQSFDLAILPRWGTDFYHAAFLAYFSGAPNRVGYSEKVSQDKQIINRGLDRLLTHILQNIEPKHEVLRSLEILQFLGGTIKDESLELWITDEDKNLAGDLLAFHGYDGNNILFGLSPGASEKGKQWPLANFIELGARLIKKYGAWIAVVGGKTEEAFGRMLKNELGEKVIDAVGQTTLRQTSALLGQCDLYVGNDSGPMHLAAAMKVPVVEISRFPLTGPVLHPQSPFRFGPWGVAHRILQPAEPLFPCTQESCMAREAHCICQITVDQVEGSVEDLLNDASFAA